MATPTGLSPNSQGPGTGERVERFLHPAEMRRLSLDVLLGKWVGREESISDRRESRNLLDDSTIVMKVRGSDPFDAHWKGWAEIAPDHVNFGLRTWILESEDRTDKIIGGKAFEAIREHHQGTHCTRSGSVVSGWPT